MQRVTYQRGLRGLASVLTVAGAFATAGCGAEVEGDATAESDLLSFETADQALTWLAAKVPAHPGAHVIQGGDGTVKSITFDDLAARDALLGEMKAYRAVRVAGHEYEPAAEMPPADSADPSTDARVSALTTGISDNTQGCNGNFCVSSWSTNQHYSVFGIGYHHVAGFSGITSGNTKSFYCPGLGGFGLGLTCNIPGYTLTFDPDFTSTCKLQGNYLGAACVKKNGTEHVGVSVTYFTNSSNCGSGHCVSQPVPVRTDQAFVTDRQGVGLSQTAIGYFVLPCTNNYGPAECYIDGVCTHTTGDANGAFANTVSASGSYDCN